MNAQTVNATLTGTVSDSSGALVPNATVTATHVDTNTSRRTVSDVDGSFTIPQLRPGVYEVIAELEGFKRAVVQNLTLQVDTAARVDLTLQVGAVSESVEVTAAAALVASETSSVGQVVTTRQIESLPLNGRSFYQLALLAPGTAPTMPRTFIGGNHPIPGQLSVPAFHVGGARETSNGYLVDGIDAQDPHFQTPSMYPSVDAIQEFKLQTNSYSAEFGRYAAQINVATRSGTNMLHGSVYEFFRNDDLDAANFFDNYFARGKSPLRYNQFGAAAGGPLSIPGVYSGKDRTFFFLSWESSRIRRGRVGQLNVPTREQRAGNFNPVGVRGNRLIYDPSTTTRNAAGQIVREPFPNNVIPSNRITQFGADVLKYWPDPNLDTTTGNNYSRRITDESDSDQLMLRIDHRFSEKDSLAGRYSIMDGDTANPAAVVLGGTANFVRTQNAALSYTRVFTTSTVNELRLGYNRPRYYQLQEGANGENIPLQLGLRNLLSSPVAFGIPTVGITGYSGIGSGTFNPSTQVTNSYQLVDQVSHVRRAHTVKFGVDIRKLNYNDQTERQARGEIAFSGGLTANPVAATSTGVSIADMLLGLPNSASGSSTTLAGRYDGWVYGLFAQDDWRIASRVTLNLGLRYELSSRLVEGNDRLGYFDPSFPGGRVLLAGKAQAYLPGGAIVEGPRIPRGTIKNDTNNWGPRVGLAIRPFNDNRTAIRAGYGLFYEIVELQDLRTWTRNPPFGLIMSLQTDQNGNTSSPAVLKTSDLFPAQGSLLARPDIYSAGGNYSDPYFQQWNLTIQRELLPQTVVEVGYIGSKGTLLARRLNAAQATLEPDPLRPTSINARRRFPLFGNTIRTTYNDGNSTYHGFISQVQKRFSQGYSFSVAYTYSKTIDGGSLIDEQPRDIYNQSLDKGRASFDLRQRLVISGTFELPFGKAKPWLTSGLGSMVLGGWTINTITEVRSGFPFSVAARGDVCNCAAANQTATQVGDPWAVPEKSINGWFNPAAFVQPQNNTLGTTGRNILDAPGSQNVDLSLFRTIPFGERLSAQIRAEAFNVLNHANFGAPGNQVGTTNYTLIQSAAAGRILQLAVKLRF